MKQFTLEKVLVKVGEKVPKRKIDGDSWDECEEGGGRESEGWWSGVGMGDGGAGRLDPQEEKSVELILLGKSSDKPRGSNFLAI